MFNVEERLNYLDGVVAELAHAQLRSEVANKELRHTVERSSAAFERLAAKMGQSVDRMDGSLDRMDGKFANMGKTQDRMDATVQNMGKTQDRMDSTVQNMESTVKSMGKTQDRMDATVQNMDATVQNMGKTQDRMDATVKNMDDTVEKMGKTVDKMDATVEKMDESLDKMERDREVMQADTRAMKKAWGDLANKMGTVAEDVVAPNIPRLAIEEFGFGETEDLLVRVRRASRRGEKRQTEYDVICSGPDKVIVVEVKSTPKIEHVKEFPEKLAEFFDFYPEYEGRAIIPIIASWSIDAKLMPAISKAGFYGLAMGDETMEIVVRPRNKGKE
jgi:chromosome segregation ATPase